MEDLEMLQIKPLANMYCLVLFIDPFLDRQRIASSQHIVGFSALTLF